MSIGDLFLTRMKTAKKVTVYQLAYIIFETMRIVTKYCIMREIHINILKIHVHSDLIHVSIYLYNNYIHMYLCVSNYINVIFHAPLGKRKIYLFHR